MSHVYEPAPGEEMISFPCSCGGIHQAPAEPSATPGLVLMDRARTYVLNPGGET